MAYRKERIEKIIERELASTLMFEAHDELLRFISITKVSLNQDLSVALVFYTVMGTDEEKIATSKQLEKSKGFLRTAIAKKLDIKKTPELRFKYDDSIEYAKHIEDILDSINK